MDVKSFSVFGLDELAVYEGCLTKQRGVFELDIYTSAGKPGQ